MSLIRNNCSVTDYRAVRRDGLITQYFRSKDTIEEENMEYNNSLNQSQINQNKRNLKRSNYFQNKLTKFGFATLGKIEQKDNGKWGDSQKNKKDTTIRVVSHNINRMPLNKNRPKNKAIWKTIQDRD